MMRNSWYKKGLVFGVIIMFLGLGGHPAVAVKNETSDDKVIIDSDNDNSKKNNLNGHDLKIENVHLSYGQKGHYWAWFVVADVINIGEPIVDGYLEVYYNEWRWRLFREDKNLHFYSMSRGGVYWDKYESKGISGGWEMRYPIGIYRILFSVHSPGDINPDNNYIDSYFFIMFNRIIRSVFD